MKVLLIALSTLFFLKAQSEQVEPLPVNIDGTICKLGGEVRHLHLVAAGDQPDKFDVLYTKLGQEQSVGKLKNHDSGVGIIRRVTKNLSDGGWSCREVKSFEVSNNPNEEQNAQE